MNSIQEVFDRAFSLAKSDGWVPEETQIMAIQFGNMQVPITGVLFDRGFMQGLFGTHMVNEKGKKADSDLSMKHIWQPAWKWHAKGMVLADDPIEYLVNYLNETK